MPRKSLLVVAALAVASVLAGCTGIPFTGAVSKGVPAVNDVISDIQYLPAGPSDGATPEQILRGFVEAGTSPAGDWKIARQYLASDFATNWDPRAGVIVDGGTRRVVGASSGGLTLSTEVQATVDALGNYQPARSVAAASYSYSFTQDNGQWRISNAPAGIIIDSATFPRVFSATPLFFYVAGTSTLVPDMRWFPARVSTSTNVIKALMTGPSPWLAAEGEIVTAIPAGASLVADSVPVDSGVANVNFDSRTVKVTQTLADRVLRQVASSLVGVPEISSVSLYFSGNLQGQIPVPSLQTLVSPKAVNPSFVMREGLFGYFDGEKITPLAGDISSQIFRLKPTAVSVATNRGIAIANTSRGVYLLRTSRPSTLVDSRSGVLPAVIDAQGFVWSAQASSPNNVMVTNASGIKKFISLPWAAASTLSVLSISPDGTRLVAGFTTPQGTRLCAAAIGRGDDHWPTRVGACRELIAPSGSLASAVWLDAMRVAVLTESRTPNLRIMTVGGTYLDITPPVGTVGVFDSEAVGTARILTSSGDVYDQSSTSRWTLIASKVTLLGSAQ